MLLSRLDRALSGQASKGGRDRQPAAAALESARRDRGAHGAAASDVTRTVQPIVG